MKNSLFIDFDSEREDKIKISKSEEMFKKFEDTGSSKQMVIDDLTTVCNALGTLIQVAHENNIADKAESAKLCIEYLTETFINKLSNNE
jgi:hypothetical protein